MSANAPIILLAAQVCLVAAIYSAGFNDIRLQENVAVVDAFIVLSAAFGAAHYLLKIAVPRIPVWMGAGLMILVFHALIAAYFSDNAADQGDAMKLLLAIGVFPLTIFLVLFRDERALMICALAFVAGGLTNALVSYLQITGLAPPAIGYSDRTFINRYSALTVHPNHLGIHCALALSFVFAPMLHGRLSRVLKLAYFASVTVLIGGVLVSGSRAAIIASVGSFSAIMMIGARRWRTIVFAVLVSAPIIVLFVSTSHMWSSYLPADSPLQSAAYSLDRMFGRIDDVSDSDAERKDAIAEAITSWYSAPIFGNGYADLRAAHNIYFQLLNAAGLVGFFAFFLILSGGLFTAIKLITKGGISPSNLILIGGAGSIVSYFIFGLVQNGIYDRFLYVPLGFILAGSSVPRVSRNSYNKNFSVACGRLPSVK